MERIFLFLGKHILEFLEAKFYTCVLPCTLLSETDHEAQECSSLTSCHPAPQNSLYVTGILSYTGEGNNVTPGQPEESQPTHLAKLTPLSFH